MSENGLSARELLVAVCEKLVAKHKPTRIDFPERILAVIADDSDYHRTRTGYTGYQSADIYTFGGKRYAIARGEACGSYPADPFDSDIIAAEITVKENDKDACEEVKSKLKRNKEYRDSLVFAYANGNLATTPNTLSIDLGKLIRPQSREFVAHDLETNPRLFYMDMRPVVTKAIRYKHEFADFLAGKMEAVLSQ